MRPFEAGVLFYPAPGFGYERPIRFRSHDHGIPQPFPGQWLQDLSEKGEVIDRAKKFIESKLDRTLVFNENGRVALKHGMACQDTSIDSRSSFPITFLTDQDRRRLGQRRHE